MADLDSLRSEIRSIDEKILELVKERFECSQKIGEIKGRSNLPVKNYKVEKKLLERNEAIANRLNLWPELAHDLTKTLISYSVRLQDEYKSEKSRRGDHSQRNVCVIGGLGQMGRWLCEFFESFGDHVRTFDQKGDSSENRFRPHGSLESVCRESDIIVTATPINITSAVIKDIADIGSEALVFDISSLKSPILASIDYALERGIRITSAHPMFGPQTKLLSGRNIVICETKDKEANKICEEIFSKTTAKIVKVALEDHDQYMAYVLGLSHLINLVFADVLRTSGISFDKMKEMASTTFNSMIDVTTPVVFENESLYYEIQAENFYSKELFSSLEQTVREYTSAATAGNSEEFCKLMLESRNYFNDSPTSALSD